MIDNMVVLEVIGYEMKGFIYKKLIFYFIKLGLRRFKLIGWKL